MYLPVQEALAESRKNIDMSIKPSYVTKNNMQDENQILPLIHIYPQQHVQVFSESQSLFIQVIPSAYFWTTIKH